jgi:hypothetical protein
MLKESQPVVLKDIMDTQKTCLQTSLQTKGKKQLNKLLSEYC